MRKGESVPAGTGVSGKPAQSASFPAAGKEKPHLTSIIKCPQMSNESIQHREYFKKKPPSAGGNGQRAGKRKGWRQKGVKNLQKNTPYFDRRPDALKRR